MAFDSRVKGVWAFNQNLDDEVLNRDFSNALLQPAKFKSFQQYTVASDTTRTRYGLVFEDDKPFTAGTDFTFTTTGSYQINIGFWWNSPDALGFTRHNVTRRMTTKIGPIIAKADSTIVAGTETPSLSEFIVSEVASTTKKNAIRFALCSTNGFPTHFFTSESYDPGLHHIFINYKSVDSSFGFVRIDIDGKYGTQYSAPGGMSASTGALRLNDIGYDFTSHKETRTNAFIADLIVRAFGSLSAKHAVRMMRYGWEYIATTSLLDNDYIYFGASYDQPSTVNTNQIQVDGRSIFVARSNGQFLKGTQPIWDREFSYKTPERLKFLNISEQDENRTAEWSDDGIKLKGTKIRV